MNSGPLPPSPLNHPRAYGSKKSRPILDDLDTISNRRVYAWMNKHECFMLSTVSSKGV